MARERNTSDRFHALSPRDVAITLRSLERRFGGIRSAEGDSQLQQIIERPGPGGAALGEIVTETARGASLIANALDTALDAQEPVIAAAVLDPSERVFVDDRGWSLSAAVETLTAEAERAASRVESASAAELSRSLPVTGSGTTTPLEVAQQLARELIGALGRSENQIEWLRSQL